MLEAALKDEGFEVTTARDGVEALRAVQRDHPDLVILDLVLPRLGGLQVCRRIRTGTRTASTPIIVVSAEGGESEKIEAFDSGADDYVAKPFRIRELLARINAVRRRASPAAPSKTIKAGMIDMDLERWTLTVDGKPVALTLKELELLRAMLEARGRGLTWVGL